jgi:hypothetical protein
MRRYVALALAAIPVGFASDPKLRHGTIRPGLIPVLVFAALFVVLLNLALLKRHRWAWYLSIILYVIGAASILYEHVKPLSYAYSLVSLALLLSPPMREYMYEARRRAAGVST